MTATQEAEKGYNGWTNYETWAVALWIDNDEYLCNERVPELVRQTWKDAMAGNYEWQTREFVAECELRDAVKDLVEDPENGIIPEIENGLAADLLNAALSEVDWQEIARHYLDDLAQEDRDAIDNE